ncbi:MULTISPECIES: hypothetical protein [unclassified Nocardioides]|uniref:hypothetical protein n=1 Tax=unclassified Nocardioides TaxID=2615069 RepID=UPI0000EB6412|nr:MULTISPECIES: hypothetical protein [unclassified Nocardioides]ABL83912.1 hypothetical protein Noca_4415 [Nocardioides sp. JS614]
MRALRYAATAVVLGLALGGCGGSDPDEPRPGPTPTPAPSTSTAATPDASAGSSDAGPATDLLDWQPVDGPVEATATRSGEWTLTVDRGGRGYRLDGPEPARGTAGPGQRVGDALIDGDWAVVVLQDQAEQRPMTAEVTDLATGKRFRVDGHSQVPTTTGGTWALGEGRLVHATVGAKGAYCLATVDLATRASEVGWCAPKRHGFNDARITPAGTSLLSFDDGQPSCRTLVSVEGDRATPFPGVEDCKGWDGLRTDDGAVWSVIPKERQVESAHFYASAGDTQADLGPGTAGTLVWCAGAAYFVRDPQREGDPASLMRWAPDTGLAVVYRSPGGQAFLAEPRCGGDTLTVTALAEDGDEQVAATLS